MKAAAPIIPPNKMEVALKVALALIFDMQAETAIPEQTVLTLTPSLLSGCRCIRICF